MTSGQIVSFRSKIKESVSGTYTKNTPEGIPQQKAEWGRSVRESHHAHGMKNVYEQIHGCISNPFIGTGERCFDHGFASRHCEIIDSGYHHEWRNPDSAITPHFLDPRKQFKTLILYGVKIITQAREKIRNLCSES